MSQDNWKIIPQVFFDILGRVVPGTFLLGITCLCFPHTIFVYFESLAERIGGFAWSASIVIISAYYLAIIFQHFYLALSFNATEQITSVGEYCQYLATQRRKNAQGSSAYPEEEFLRVVAEMAGAEAVLGGVFTLLMIVLGLNFEDFFYTAFLQKSLVQLLQSFSMYDLAVIVGLFFLFSIFHFWHDRLFAVLQLRQELFSSTDPSEEKAKETIKNLVSEYKGKNLIYRYFENDLCLILFLPVTVYFFSLSISLGRYFIHPYSA